MSPSNLQWEVLTRPYGGTGAAGRRHPAYTEPLFKRAVAMGVDSGRQPLHSAMPRYRLTHQESADLVAYLKRISTELDPGVEATRLRLGVVLPPAGPLDGVGRGVRAVLEARFEQLNQAGGLYGRSIDLEFVTPPSEGWRRRSEVASFVETEEVFALLAAYMPGAERELAAFSSAEGVPSVGPLSLYPQVGKPLNPYVFYLLPGLDQQARSLVEFASRKDPERSSRLLLLHGEDPSLASVVSAAREQAQELGWPAESFQAHRFSREAPVDLQSLAAGAGQEAEQTFLLFLSGEPQTRSLLEALARGPWRPTVLLLGPLAGEAGAAPPRALSDRVFVSQPTLTADRTRRSLAAYRTLRPDADQSSSAAVELAALASAEVMIEALRRSGKAVSRQKLVEALESFYQVSTGLTPPLTFTPNRRVGALGAYVVAADPETGRYPRSGPWIPSR